MKKVLFFSVALILCLAVPALAENYVKADQFKQWLAASKPMLIVDIQPAEQFAKNHFKNSIETQAFPAKTDEDKKKLDAILPKLQSSKDPIVIMCPRGKLGAKNTYVHLKGKGIPESRLFILEDGIQGWPYKELFVQGK